MYTHTHPYEDTNVPNPTALNAPSRMEHPGADSAAWQLALQSERDFFAAVLDTAGALVVVLDTEGRIRRFNRACEQTTGYQAHEVLDRLLWSFLLVPEEVEPVKAVFEQLRAGLFPNSHENYWVAKDGTRRRIAWTNTCIVDSAGAVEFVVGTGIDVTEQRLAENASRDAAAQHRLALEAGNLGTWEYHFVSGEVTWDERCRNLFGVAAGDRFDYASAIDKIHQADREEVDRAVQAALSPDSSGAYGREYRVLWPDGALRWIAATGEVSFHGEGTARKPVRFVGTVQDITERKLTAETLNFLALSGTAPGRDFLESLCRHLGETLGAEFVRVDRWEQDGQTAKTVAVFADGTVAERTSDVSSGPHAGEVVGQAAHGFPSAVGQRVPKEAALPSTGTANYKEVTLRGHAGQPIGRVAVIGRHPLRNPPLVESLLRLVAGRAAGELERALAEQALRESEERFRTLFEQAAVGVAQIETLTGRFVKVNQKYADIVGYLPEELQGLTFQQLTHPEDLAADLENMRRLEQGDLREFTMEKRYFHRNGSEVWVNVTVSAMGPPGATPEFRIAVVEDITERKRIEAALALSLADLERVVDQRTAELRETNARLREEIEAGQRKERELSEAERRYRTVADFTYDWEYWKAPDGALVYCSPSCERITGYPAAQLIGDPDLLARMVHLEDRDGWQQHHCDTLPEAENRAVVFRIHRHDDHQRWIEHSCQRVIGSRGEFLGIRASNRDITDRKQAEIAMQHLREELCRISRITAAGQLAAALAHELNQPLGAIVCNAQAAERYLDEASPPLSEVREILSDIAVDSQRAGNVIQRLRALYQKGDQERTAVQLNKVIQDTVALFRGELLIKGILVQLDLAAGLPSVFGNYVELQQILINLVVNAVDAMAGRESGMRRLQVATAWGDRNTVRVSVRDSGTGLSAEHLSRVGEPFFTTKPTGMGMGLAISHSILEAHGGRLSLENNPDHGATFHLEIPVMVEGAT